MELIDNIQQYQLYVDAIKPSGSTGFSFYKNNGSLSPQPEFDFWFPIFLTRTYKVYEYVEVSKEEEIAVIERQEINPYFIELSFFDTIKKHKVLIGSDLSIQMIQFIRDTRLETADFSSQQVIEWFDNIGVNELPWFRGTDREVTADDIDKISLINTHTVSKANYHNIDINR